MTIVAHRGNAGQYPENSLAAIKSACELGAEFVEIDVQFSSDYVPFVIHDNSLQRTFGLIEEVQEEQSASLIDFGVPTLDEIGAMVAEYPHVKLFVEIKSESVDYLVKRDGPETLRKLLERVAERFGGKTAPTEFIVIAFDEAIVGLFQEMYPWYHTGLCLADYSPKSRAQLRRLGCAFAFVDYHDIKDEQLSKMHTWVAYEVPSKEIGDKLLNQGIGLLETMKVEEMLKSYK